VVEADDEVVSGAGGPNVKEAHLLEFIHPFFFLGTLAVAGRLEVLAAD